MLSRGRAQARATFSERELWLIADMLNGTAIISDFIELLWAEASDGCFLDGLDEKWGVDSDVLVRKLRGAELSTLFAVADAVEQFWLQEEPGSILATFDHLDGGGPRSCAPISYEGVRAVYKGVGAERDSGRSSM